MVNLVETASDSSEEAVNTVVNLHELRRVVNPHLVKCTECTIGTLELVESNRVALASTIKLVCKECNLQDDRETCHDQYLLTEIRNSTCHIESKIKKRYPQQCKRRRSTKKEKTARARTAAPLPSAYQKNRKGNRPRTIDYQCNIRGILS